MKNSVLPFFRILLLFFFSSTYIHNSFSVLFVSFSFIKNKFVSLKCRLFVHPILHNSSLNDINDYNYLIDACDNLKIK